MTLRCRVLGHLWCTWTPFLPVPTMPENATYHRWCLRDGCDGYQAAVLADPALDRSDMLLPWVCRRATSAEYPALVIYEHGLARSLVGSEGDL